MKLNEIPRLPGGRLEAEFHGRSSYGEWILYYANDNTEQLEEIDWPEDWPERVDGDFMRSKGFEVIRA